MPKGKGRGSYLGIDEPNIIVPLVSSYNTRGIDAEDNVFTDLLDQRKINCMYDVINNAASDSSTSYLVKRPGVAAKASTYGTSGQTAYLVELASGALTVTDANHWVVSKSGDDIRVSDTTTTTVVDSTAGYVPVYIDKTIVSDTDTVVLQLRNSSGTSKVYYSTAIGVWTQISDSDFTPLVLKGKMEFMDGYAFGLTSTNKIYNSGLNSLSAWDSTNYIVKQIVQDTPTGLARLNKLLIAFGLSTIEVFHDVGNATGSPLENLADKAIKGVGMAPVDGSGVRHYYTVHNNILYFIGNNPIGVYAYNGSVIEKVSNHAIDKILASGAYYNVSTVTFSGKTAVCIALDTVSATTQDSLLFFPEWKDWFQWQSTVFQPVTSDRLGNTFLGIGASSTGHTLYTLSEATDNWQDAGTNYTETIQFKIPGKGNQIKRMRFCGVEANTARAASSLNVSFSNDDGQNWTTARTIDMTSMTKMLRNCGSYRDRQVRITHTGNEENRIESFIARVE